MKNDFFRVYIYEEMFSLYIKIILGGFFMMFNQKSRVILFLCVILILSFVFGGCSVKENSEESRALCETMLDHIISDDYGGGGDYKTKAKNISYICKALSVSFVSANASRNCHLSRE